MPYAIRLPDGTLVQNIPDDLPPEEAKKRIIAAGLIKPPAPPETTILGQVKEGFKGLVPGAVGLVESAATGASALLPEQYEKTAREKIASIAGAAKAPFAAAPGYEETVGRKLGEAVGSTVPFLAAGPLGLAGRIGAVGLGVGAGAGEARTRAEKEGATAEQRGTATALGVIPGALEAFAPLRILSRIPDAATAQGVQLVKRALVAGGEEAAQEAASGFAQNLIARGVYKPEQELIEGLGEQAAYGGATGAIVQGLMDLALGRRARGAVAPPPEAAPGVPGETPIERAAREAAEKAPAPPAPPVGEPPAPPAGEPLAPPVEPTPPVGEPPAPPVGEPPAPPIAETPAPPPIEEPKVRKVGEPIPLPDVLDAATVNRIGFSRGKVHDALVGKSVTDPEIRTVLEEYLNRPTANTKTAEKINAFLARLPEPVAPPVVETAPPAPPPEVEAAAPAVPPAEPAVEVPVGVAPSVPETPSVTTTPTEPEAGGAGAPVVSQPDTGAAPEGVGAVEPTGVVPPVADVGQPAGREEAKPAAVAPAPAPKPAALPEFTEADIDRAVETGLLTEEQAEIYRAELREEEAPPTAMGAAFQKQIDDIEAQMDALRQKNGRPPAKKTPAGAKFEALKAQLESLQTKETGDLAERLEKMGASGVVGTRGERPVIDLDAVRENLTKARAAPKMYQAVLNYIGVDAEGNYLPTTYSREDAAEMAGLGRGSGANVTRVAQSMGITADVVSRFHAGQTDIIVLGKNVSEAGTGATDLQPTRGVLYEAPKKNQPGKAAGFLRDALTPDGKLDFSKVPLNSKKATKDSPAVTGLAEIYARASNYDPGRGGNLEVIKKLNEEIAARTETDRRGVQAALDRAYRVVRTEEEAAAEQADIERVAEEGVEPEAVEEEDKTRRLSDEDTDFQQSRTGPVDLENSREMDTALRGKSFTEAIDYAIKNARDDLDRQVLVKVKRRAEELANKGVEFSFDLTPQGKVLTGALGVATTTPAGLGDATKVNVTINGFTGIDSNTLSQETLVHELIHAVTSAQIAYAPQGTAAIKLRALQQELVAIYNQRYRAGTLTATEKGVVSRALENAKELLAYGLTNGDVQNWLASTPSPTGGTFLSRMFNIVSQVLGLKGKENSALARLMAISEEILDESLTPYVAEANRQGLSFGKQANLTGVPSWALKESRGLKTVWHKGPVALYEGISTANKPIFVAAKQGVVVTNVDIRSYNGAGFTPTELAELRQAADSLTPQASPRLTAEATTAAAEADAIGERKQTTLTEKVGRELQGNTALRLREKFTDSMAALEDFFVNAYGGQIRTAGGRLNPMVLLSRALDALRVSKAVQEQGGLGRQDGLIVATELKNDKGESISYQGVLKRIADAAKAEGKTYEEYQKTIDNVLYGHREFNLRERNKTLDADEQVDLLLDDKQIDALEAAFQKDEFIKSISADLDAIRFNLLDTLVETGRISKEQAQDYKDAVGYIPFERIGDYENAWTGATRGANRGAAALKKMRKLEGSNRKSTSVVENFSGLVDWATKEAMKNEAASRALEDMVLLGAAKRGPKPATDSPGDVVKVYENGKEVEYYVPDPAHFVAFSIADPQLSKILRAFQRGAQVLRAGVTSMPPFAIKQVFDDVVRAYTYAGVKNNAALVRNVLFNFPKNWMNEILKRKPEGIRELEALGIVGTFDFSQQGGNLQNILEGAGAKKEGLGSSILRVMEAGAKASDVAVREAIYKQVLKETGDKAQAESAAREIINFSRRGSSKMMSQMISIIPFFNAYARGMDKLATAAAGKVVGQTTGTARSMFYSRMAVLTAMGLAYALMMQDDEEYNKLPDHVRDTNWILPYGKELGFTPAIPIPADLAFFFKAIPERLVRYYKYQGTDEERTAMEVLGELTKRGIDVFSSPNVTPQILRPFIENIVNYSWFLGRPLESQAQLKLRPFERYGTGTSDTMKAVAEILEDAANATGIEAFAVSPIKLENAVRGLLGSAAGLSLSVADMVVNPSRTDRPLHQQLVPQLTGAAAVMKNPVGTRYMDEIYSLENRTEQVYGTYNRLKQNDPDKAEQFLDDNIGMYEIRPAVRAVMKQIRDLNKMAMEIDKDTTLSPEERRKEIDELRAEQNEIARVVFSLRKEARDIQMGL